jgi:hypothetical protein
MVSHLCHASHGAAQVETAHALARYHDAGAAPTPPTALAVARLLLVTNGNGAEIRALARNTRLLGTASAAPLQMLL